jgi:predicted small integral membrane protein
MLDKVGFSIGLSFILLGGILLFYDRALEPSAIQTAGIIAGAVFLSLGLVTVWFAAKSWWEWRRYFKEHR